MDPIPCAFKFFIVLIFYNKMPDSWLGTAQNNPTLNPKEVKNFKYSIPSGGKQIRDGKPSLKALRCENFSQSPIGAW